MVYESNRWISSRTTSRTNTIKEEKETRKKQERNKKETRKKQERNKKEKLNLFLNRISLYEFKNK